MFTGLIECTGEIVSVAPIRGGSRIALKPGFDTAGASMGESIAINGVCLTVVEIKPAQLSFDISPETLKSTNLGELRRGAKVNLERAMTMSGRFGGHLVSGHVDGTGVVKSVTPTGEFTYYKISAPAEVLSVSIKKGSITVDGVSLTIVDLDDETFTIAIIPHTAGVTTIGAFKAGDRVNIESDMIGKYVARLLEPRAGSGGGNRDKSILGLLQEEGFIK
ncbi:MAG: riboflavin synthase [Nitrospirae bacterium]|nr:riboflavin synthase [Nitrospirota bacterium]